jgi:hypothetical protein
MIIRFLALKLKEEVISNRNIICMRLVKKLSILYIVISYSTAYYNQKKKFIFNYNNNDNNRTYFLFHFSCLSTWKKYNYIFTFLHFQNLNIIEKIKNL